MPKMLIADDNVQITSILSKYAISEGFEAVCTFDGGEAYDAFNDNDFDIILLDVSMPVMDGFEVCKLIRKKSNVPIIMVTAKGEDFEKIMGLEIGADDYVIKPFSPAEVMARVKAILRRININENANNVITIDNLKIDLDKYQVTIGADIVTLTKKETELLWTLAVEKNKVFSRDNLLSSLWGYDYFGDSRTVDSHIKRLRAKIDAYDHPNWEIKTIWGVGYKFMESEDVGE